MSTTYEPNTARTRALDSAVSEFAEAVIAAVSATHPWDQAEALGHADRCIARAAAIAGANRV